MRFRPLLAQGVGLAEATAFSSAESRGAAAPERASQILEHVLGGRL